MKFTRRWLLEHLDGSLDAAEIAAKLTMAGLEVEAMTRLDQGLDRVCVGRLLEVGRHPDADRLTVCRVEVGEESLAIVCGATNHKVGDKVAVARIGARLPNGLTIKKGRIRGELSEGMLASSAELGLGAGGEGILILPADAVPGRPVAEYLHRDDTLFELSLTPNRGDGLGVRGIARELAALTGMALRPLTNTVKATLEESLPVILEHKEGCPRYAGRIIRDVQVGPSPEWLRNRLELVGQKSINNVVDITNFILLDLNHPMHAFDLGCLHPPVVVRGAFEGETLTTLDGITRELTPENLVIADGRRPLALAGIMGGEASGVSGTTTALFLEVAYFAPTLVARTGRRLGIMSDSRYRFERGVDPMGLVLAMERATQLILELCGGQAGPIQVTDAGSWKPVPPIPCRFDRINRLLGMNLPEATMESMLTGIGCEKKVSGGATYFLPPSHRHDLVLEEDLLEEVLRLHGYDKAPSVLPWVQAEPQEFDSRESLSWAVRHRLTAMGYLETINYAFVSREMQQRFDAHSQPTELLNPISEEMAVMRTTLSAGLLESARRNLSRGNLRLRLFEIGHCFLPGDRGDLVERERLAGLLSGEVYPRSWHTPSREVDFFDLKGSLEGLFASLGFDPFVFQAGGPEFLHPGQKAVIFSAGHGESVGWMGRLHPAHQEMLDPAQAVFLFELEMDPIQARMRREGRREMVTSRFPAIERDFAFLVDEAVGVGPFMEVVRQTEPAWIQEVRLFDVFKGESLPEGKKSFAINVTLRASDKTLTDVEAQEVCQRIVSRVQQTHGAVQR